jgi:methionine synthase II (cobalamin-independent)
MMDKKRLKKEFYKVDLDGNAVRGNLVEYFLIKLKNLDRGQVKSTQSWQAYMRNLMKVEGKVRVRIVASARK